VLQIDRRIYFPSIDHQILMAQLREMITCPGTQWLLALIVAACRSVHPRTAAPSV
jgi:hypothetical protein